MVSHPGKSDGFQLVEHNGRHSGEAIERKQRERQGGRRRRRRRPHRPCPGRRGPRFCGAVDCAQEHEGNLRTRAKEEEEETNLFFFYG